MSSAPRSIRTRVATRGQPAAPARQRSSAAKREVNSSSESSATSKSSSSSSSSSEEEPRRAKKPRRLAVRKQKMKKRTSAVRRRTYSNSESSADSNSSSASEEESRRVIRPRRAVRKTTPKRKREADIESDETEQILNQCAMIDAVCDSIPVGIQRPRCSLVPRVTTAVNSTPRTGGKLVLCEIGERLMMSFLPVLPDRLKAESVCKHWRRMSMREIAIEELDFEKVVLRSITKKHVVQILQRASGQLRRLALPDMRLDDAIIQHVLCHTDIRFFRAHRMQKKHIFQVLEKCIQLESLELLDCQGLQLSGWGRGQISVPLRKVHLNGCNFMTNQAACALIQMCGSSLKKFILTGAVNVDSDILPVLAKNATGLSELTMREVKARDLKILLEALWDSICWLDFSFCAGVSTFPDSPTLPMLQVLMLDRTQINDKGLKAIASIAPHLKYLSLQDCRMISDEGILAIASVDGCINLELIDLKGTNVTDKSILALEDSCVHLRMVRMDSCRSISREMRSKYSERARDIALNGQLNEYERISLGRKMVELIDDEQSNTESGSDSDYRR